jgi:ubiquinone/menaquinone biosynthesis C-methylase UbiE
MNYRSSHLKSGDFYDTNLKNNPFDHYMAVKEQKLLQQIIPSLFSGKIGKYLDFACGTGRITEIIEKLVNTSFGIDISENMLQQAQQKCSNTKFFIGDFTSKVFPDKNFDLVTAFRFFGNAEDDLRKYALSTINSLLSENGYFILNNHRNPFAISIILRNLIGGNDTANLSYWKIRRLLKENGFTVIRTYGIGFWVIRAKFLKLLFTNFGNTLEQITQLKLLVPFCPDFLIVARKKRTISQVVR